VVSLLSVLLIVILFEFFCPQGPVPAKSLPSFDFAKYFDGHLSALRSSTEVLFPLVRFNSASIWLVIYFEQLYLLGLCVNIRFVDVDEVEASDGS
jgi:hypothetical protein